MLSNIMIALLYGILSTFFVHPYYIKGILKGKTLFKNYDDYYNFTLSVRNTIYGISIISFIFNYLFSLYAYSLKDFILILLATFAIFAGHAGILYLSHYFLPIFEFKKYVILLSVMFLIIIFANLILFL